MCEEQGGRWHCCFALIHSFLLVTAKQQAADNELQGTEGVRDMAASHNMISSVCVCVWGTQSVRTQLRTYRFVSTCVCVCVCGQTGAQHVFRLGSACLSNCVYWVCLTPLAPSQRRSRTHPPTHRFINPLTLTQSITTHQSIHPSFLPIHQLTRPIHQSDPNPPYTPLIHSPNPSIPPPIYPPVASIHTLTP